MTPVLFVVAAASGALGRHLMHQLACNWRALLVVNVVGSGLLGAVIASDLSPAATTVLGVGFCGALTTYSGFALEVRRLPTRWAIGYALLMVLCACGAASLGAELAT